MPGETVATQVVDQSFESMGASAGMFLILMVIVLGGIWLTSIWIKNGGRKTEKSTPRPRYGYREPVQWTEQSLRPNTETLPPMSMHDTTQEIRIDSIEARLKGIDRWRTTIEKEEKLRTRDMMSLSNRITVFEVAKGEKPKGTGISLYTLGKNNEWEEDDEPYSE